jgi:CelD/BcsL family acetyltransferase involved in cellulose biosynthesis
MSAPTIREFGSADEFRAYSAEWDDLWSRSSTTVPLARAAFVAHWIDAFSPHQPIRAVAVEHDGRFVAAIPLIEERIKRVLPVLKLPTNHWASNGDLLLDQSTLAAQEQDRALDMLAAALNKRTRPLFWFDRVAYDEPHWLRFQEALRRAGRLVSRRAAYRTAQIEIGDDFEAYEAKLSASHRRNCRSRAKALERAGGLNDLVCADGEPAQIDELVRRGFEVEDRSWKGAAGTSVLKAPGMLEFYQEEARLAAEMGHLDLSFLEHQGRPIAFAYTFQAKGTYFEVKLGYDDEFKKSGPGHLLLQRKLRRLFADPQAKLLDCRGPLIPWIRNWTDRSYEVGRLVAAPSGLLGRTLFKAYDDWWPRLRSRLRPTSHASAETEGAGAAEIGASCAASSNASSNDAPSHNTETKNAERTHAVSSPEAS